MRVLLACVAVCAVLTPRIAVAQVEVAVTPIALVALQPVDDTYVGGPYLSEGIGGVAPGFGAGLSILAANHFVVSAELTSARFTQEQYGRLVGGGYATEGIPHTTKLRDTLLSVLVGFSSGGSDSRWQIVGGAGKLLDAPTVNDVERRAGEVSNGDALPFVLTGGVDWVRLVNSRASLQIGARYSFTDRPENHQYLGIGPHILRIGAGIRLRLN